jgi:hypothetical protein
MTDIPRIALVTGATQGLGLALVAGLARRAAPAAAPGPALSTSPPRYQDITRGILLAAVCPGMMNTPTSGMWWDVSGAPSPADAAVALLNLAFDPVNADHYGQLVRNGDVLPWVPESSSRTG